MVAARPERVVRVRDLKRNAIDIFLVHAELKAAARTGDARGEQLGSSDRPTVSGVLHDPPLGHAVAPLRAEGERAQQHHDGEAHDDECLAALVACVRARA